MRLNILGLPAQWLRRFTRQRQAASSTTVAPRKVYLFFDESGDLNFNVAGTAHFLCGVLAVKDPWPLMNALDDLRERLFRGGPIPPQFHAAEDRQEVRDQVFEVLQSVGGFDYYSGIAVKKDVPLNDREDGPFYATMADFTLRMALQHYPSAEPIYLITDRLPVKQKRQAVIKGFKACLASIAGGREYHIDHQVSAAQGGLQAADYLNWAVYRKWERGDERSYDLIQAYVKSETRMNWTPLKD